MSSDNNWKKYIKKYLNHMEKVFIMITHTSYNCNSKYIQIYNEIIFITNKQILRLRIYKYDKVTTGFL